MYYKGYFAKVEFDSEDHIFVGHVVGIPDIVGFHGASREEFEIAFREAISNYLAACSELTKNLPRI